VGEDRHRQVVREKGAFVEAQDVAASLLQISAMLYSSNMEETYSKDRHFPMVRSEPQVSLPNFRQVPGQRYSHNNVSRFRGWRMRCRGCKVDGN
jgi:hypothetical protein